MTIKDFRRFQPSCIVCAFCFVGHAALAQQPYAEVERDAHAKGILTFLMIVPESGHVQNVSLGLSFDGEQYEESRGGFPRPGRLIYSAENHLGKTRVLVPIVGRFSGGEKGFMFASPGTYYLRWTVSFGSGSLDRKQILQRVEVGEPLNQDAEFLARISDPDVLRRLFASNVLGWLVDKDGDIRALHVIRRLLNATRLAEPLEGGGWGRYESTELFLMSMDTMFALAKELPESSYAPYAAFYAGGGYITHLCHSDEIPGDVPKDLRSHPLYQKIKEALSFAVEHGDSYLRPRAIFQQARLHVVMGSWDDAEDKLIEAEQGVGEGGTIGEFAEIARNDIIRLKKRQLDRGNGDTARHP